MERLDDRTLAEYEQIAGLLPLTGPLRRYRDIILHLVAEVRAQHKDRDVLGHDLIIANGLQQQEREQRKAAEQSRDHWKATASQLTLDNLQCTQWLADANADLQKMIRIWEEEKSYMITVIGASRIAADAVVRGTDVPRYPELVVALDAYDRYKEAAS